MIFIMTIYDSLHQPITGLWVWSWPWWKPTSTPIWTIILIMTMMKAYIDPYLDYDLDHDNDESLHRSIPWLWSCSWPWLKPTSIHTLTMILSMSFMTWALTIWFDICSISRLSISDDGETALLRVRPHHSRNVSHIPAGNPFNSFTAF